jgi:hypothetical protein
MNAHTLIKDHITSLPQQSSHSFLNSFPSQCAHHHNSNTVPKGLPDHLFAVQPHMASLSPNPQSNYSSTHTPHCTDQVKWLITHSQQAILLESQASISLQLSSQTSHYQACTHLIAHRATVSLHVFKKTTYNPRHLDTSIIRLTYSVIAHFTSVPVNPFMNFWKPDLTQHWYIWGNKIRKVVIKDVL